MTAPLHLSTAQRRARLVARHHLAGDAPSVHAAVHALLALHSSDPITPHLALQARVPGFTPEAFDHAMSQDRALWRLHAMRRTLFVVTAQDAPDILVAATADIAAKERRRVEQWLAADMPAADIAPWLAAREAEVLDFLADGVEHTTAALNAALPHLQTPITLGSGKHTQVASIGSRLLFLMAMDGSIIRTRPAGSWRSSQYHWSAAHPWFGPPAAPPDRAAASAAVLGRYLASHGPATLTDLRWWSGWTVKQTRAALEKLGAITVTLQDSEPGYLLPHDLDAPTPDAAPTAALLPGLDSTPMGWKERDWYLGPHTPRLFDTNGNVGPTAWWGGRIVGGWAQRPNGEVALELLEDAGEEAARELKAKAEALTGWLEGCSITPRFRTPLERELSSS